MTILPLPLPTPGTKQKKYTNERYGRKYFIFPSSKPRRYCAYCMSCSYRTPVTKAPNFEFSAQPLVFFKVERDISPFQRVVVDRSKKNIEPGRTLSTLLYNSTSIFVMYVCRGQRSLLFMHGWDLYLPRVANANASKEFTTRTNTELEWVVR